MALATVGRMSFMMQAGSFKLASPGAPVTDAKDTKSFTRVEFETPFPKGTTVVVIPMVQTFNGADSPGLRITDVDRKGFLVRMNELVGRTQSKHGKNHQPLSDGGHIAERNRLDRDRKLDRRHNEIDNEGLGSLTAVGELRLAARGGDLSTGC